MRRAGVISDVPKTMVYRLARLANARCAESRACRRPFPESTLTKPPSAELRADQKDTDSLPEYDVLDAFWKAMSSGMSRYREISERYGISEDLVRDIVRKVDRNEYKRQQAAPGLRITAKAFGVGRRFPIAHRFTE